MRAKLRYDGPFHMNIADHRQWTIIGDWIAPDGGNYNGSSRIGVDSLIALGIVPAHFAGRSYRVQCPRVIRPQVIRWDR